MTLVLGIIVGLAVVALVVVIGILLARRGSASTKVSSHVVPPPVDPGPAQPDQARDVNADRKAAKKDAAA